MATVARRNRLVLLVGASMLLVCGLYSLTLREAPAFSETELVEPAADAGERPRAPPTGNGIRDRADGSPDISNHGTPSSPGDDTSSQSQRDVGQPMPLGARREQQGARMEGERRRFPWLADIVLVVNYNHPTDAFKSLPLWRELYGRLFLDVVFVSTEPVPELRVESAVLPLCNVTIMECVRELMGPGGLPLPLGMGPGQGTQGHASPGGREGAPARVLQGRDLGPLPRGVSFPLQGKLVLPGAGEEGSSHSRDGVQGSSLSSGPEAGPGLLHHQELGRQGAHLQPGEQQQEQQGLGLGQGGAAGTAEKACEGERGLCGCSGRERGFWAAVEQCRGRQEQAQRSAGPVCATSGYFVYASLQDVLPRYPQAAGFLWTNDDLILNYWRLGTADKSKLWLPHPDAGTAPASTPTTNSPTSTTTTNSTNTDPSSSATASTWCTVPVNSTSSTPSSSPSSPGDLGRWELKRPHIKRAVAALESLPLAQQRQFRESLLPLVGVVVKEVVDVYYIPQAHAAAVVELVPRFLAARVRSEMAIPMLFCALDHPSNFDPEALQATVYLPSQRPKTRRQAKRKRVALEYSTALSAYHPWKMREPGEAHRILQAMLEGDSSLREMLDMPAFGHDRRCFLGE